MWLWTFDRIIFHVRLSHAAQSKKNNRLRHLPYQPLYNTSVGQISMNHYITLVSMFAIVGAQGISIAEHGVAKHARSAGNASVVDGGTPVLKPPSGNTATDAFTLSEELNYHLGRDYLIALAGFVFALLLYRVVLHVVHHTRTLACLTNDTQRFFTTPNAEWNSFKLHLIHAPLFKARHKRELRLSSALNMGTLPTRFQSILLAAVLATNVALCVYGIPWHGSQTEVLSMLRNRTGSMAAANLIPIMILSSPKNPLIVMLNIPFDSMNIIHRNVARLAIFEAVIHTLCYFIGSVKTSRSCSS
jgi:Ferric reductase like transmembrane component